MSVIRISKVSDVVAKNGKSGPLLFVTIDQEFFSQDRLCISERQDFVFRDFPKTGKPITSKPASLTDTVRGTLMGKLTPDPILLFRYSALTFNSHRIHYDQGYARNTEGYPGLVVHGPLQATLLLNLAAKPSANHPAAFLFAAWRRIWQETRSRYFMLETRVIARSGARRKMASKVLWRNTVTADPAATGHHGQSNPSHISLRSTINSAPSGSLSMNSTSSARMRALI